MNPDLGREWLNIYHIIIFKWRINELDDTPPPRGEMIIYLWTYSLPPLIPISFLHEKNVASDYKHPKSIRVNLLVF